MITIDNIHKKFEKRIILNGINLTINKGEIQVIYGKNGAGKSTLLKCICGLIDPDSGKIEFKSIDKEKMGLVLDNSLLIQKLKVVEYLQFICELKRIPKTKYANKIKSILNDLDFDNEKNTLIQNLSKGTKSKLGLAAALIYDPEILILDEPFSGMDITTIDNATKLIRIYANNGSTFIISTHQTEFLPSFSDKVSILKEGIISNTLDAKTIQNNIKDDDRYSLSQYLKNQI